MRTLVVIDGPNRGAVLEIGPGESRIGRERNVELVLPDVRVSRRHAVLTVAADGTCHVTDLGSKNATYLNGIRLTGGKALAPGDELRLGDTTLVFVDATAADAAPAGAAAADPEGETVCLAQGEDGVEVVAAGAPGHAGRPRYLIGESDGIRQVSELVQRCAPLSTTVLVLGESGTGKELVCEALHRLGPRRRRPFVVVNCANLEPSLLESELFGHERGAFTGAVARKLGLLELAGDGTLFLDEIGELPLAAQAKLLRAIDRRQFHRVGGAETLTTAARFVAATHRDLPALVREGKLREDLYFRLKVAEIRLPPLRERRGDLPLLVDHLLQELRPQVPTAVRGLAPDALEVLERYPFPGNVRELRNLLERCLIFARGELVGIEDLPAEIVEAARPIPAATHAAPHAAPQTASQTAAPHAAGPATAAPVAAAPDEAAPLGALVDIEKAHIERVLARTAWNKTQAAALLGIDRNTLYAKIRAHRLAPP
ncbi:MAG: sigma 54-interacting transcriptional regulator [Planctomycetia bacterium]|nr:sigma 54-interacting transcriptional regulator [Planctomycetia bacterium]